MYTRTNKNLAIVTNFGCSRDCPGCISKGHPLIQTEKEVGDISKINWELLDHNILASNPNATTITLTGGGDPFNNWDKNKAFFEKLFILAKGRNRGIDVQTRILPLESRFLQGFHKIIYRVDYRHGLINGGFDVLKRSYSWVRSLTKIRLVQEVDEEMHDRDVFFILDFAKSVGLSEVTFKEKFGNKLAHDNFEALKSMFENYSVAGISIMWLPDEDRHEYFFLRDNTYREFYFGMAEKVRDVWKGIYNNGSY